MLPRVASSAVTFSACCAAAMYSEGVLMPIRSSVSIRTGNAPKLCAALIVSSPADEASARSVKLNNSRRRSRSRLGCPSTASASHAMSVFASVDPPDSSKIFCQNAGAPRFGAPPSASAVAWRRAKNAERSAGGRTNGAAATSHSGKARRVRAARRFSASGERGVPIVSVSVAASTCARTSKR